MLGINAQIQTSTGDGSGVGFAVPADAVSRSLAQLRRDGRARYAYLGVASVAVYPQLARALRACGTAGRLDPGRHRRRARPSAPASRRAATRSASRSAPSAPGGDVVTAVQGRPVHAESDLAKALLDYAPGDTVTLDVVRGGQRRQVRVKLGERPLDAPRRG